MDGGHVGWGVGRQVVVSPVPLRPPSFDLRRPQLSYQMAPCGYAHTCGPIPAQLSRLGGIPSAWGADLTTMLGHEMLRLDLVHLLPVVGLSR